MYNSYYTTTAASKAASTAGTEEIVKAILGIGVMFWIVLIAVAVLIYVAKWKVFKKANKDGWEALIPVHSDIIELQLGGIKTYWWFLNCIAVIPFLGWFLGWIPMLILAFWKSIALAKAFGKGAGFGVLLALFPFVMYPILAWGSAEYIGPEGATVTTTKSEE